ncbi:unnamed protein product [Symbiodinium natans]|uniref:Uncharacterized protein n=1 Tax=Symbiodinium natans TaxID=878477 RepID=A0A812PW40_9DINO|nr:unnamed protein product [Symbiodinium natans]
MFCVPETLPLHCYFVGLSFKMGIKCNLMSTAVPVRPVRNSLLDGSGLAASLEPPTGIIDDHITRHQEAMVRIHGAVQDISAGDAEKASDRVCGFKAAAAELVAEVTTRMEVLAASLRGELTAQAADLRGDLAATRAELLRKIEDNIAGGGDASQGPMGLQSSAALAGQLNEVVRPCRAVWGF